MEDEMTPEMLEKKVAEEQAVAADPMTIEDAESVAESVLGADDELDMKQYDEK